MRFEHYDVRFIYHEDLVYIKKIKRSGTRKLTICKIHVNTAVGPDGGKDFIGVAICDPRDNYKKSIGRTTAFIRALNQLTYRGDRKRLFKAYSNKCNVEFPN